MSEVIDSRIVEMRFDNSQFESNVRESMKTIDNLKSSLNFEDSVKGLDKIKVDIDASGAVQGLNAISDAAGDCDLSKLSDSAESVKLSFSALEIVAVTALGKIASAAIDAGAQAINAFAIQPITDGFAEYNQQLKATRVITSNTGQSLEEVTRILDELNEYADLTIYSFGDMTQAMGYFTSALGQNSAEASATIAKGISNWAASTGQGNEVAKRVMYQVSQGLSTGSFRLMDWKSIENTGAMAGKRYQEAFVETASEMYGLAAEEILVNKKGEEASFRDSLQTGWLTNEVFLETMRKFANETDILNEKGERAFQWMEDAATKVLTFSDLLDTVREQLGTGWGETWKIVFGDFEQSIEFFTGISKSIGNFIDKINDARNAIFRTWSDMGGRDLLFGVSETDTGAIGKFLDGILEILSQIHDAFIDAFGTEFLANMLYGATEIIAKVANAFERLSRITILHDILRSVFTILRSIFSVISDLYKIVEPFLGLALKVIEHILSGLSKVTDVVANIIDKVTIKISSLSEIITTPFQIASEFITSTFGAALDWVAEKMSSVWNFLKQFDIFGIMGGGNPMFDFAAAQMDKTKQLIDTVTNSIKDTDKAVSKSVDNATKGIKTVTERLSDLGIAINSEKDLTTDSWMDIFWNAIDKEKRRQYYAEELWEEVKNTDDLINGDVIGKTWLDAAEANGLYDPELLAELKDIWEQWAQGGEHANKELSKTATSLDGVNTELESTEKKSKEVTGTWWDLIKDTDKQQYFMAEYWDQLTEEQKEGWKQYALGLGLFTEEELKQLENAEKSVDNILSDRERLANKKRSEADAWWDLIDEDKKKQYFAGQFWDDLTDEQREAWRKRAEEYNLYDPEEYARLLAEMNAAEQAAFSPENTQEIAESTAELDNWFSNASKVPVIGGFLEKFGWVITKTVKNSKSFAGAVKTSFGGFIDYVKMLNGTDYTFSEKFGLASKYFKENVSDYLGELVLKNFKTVSDTLSNTPIVGKLTSFTTAVRDRFKDFKNYVSEINKNSELTFPEKFKLSLDYFKTNVVDYLGQLVGKNLKEIGANLTDNKIVSNLVSFVGAAKTKFGEFKDYISELNANTELTFPEKLEKALSFLKTNVIDYFLELINKNLKSLGIDIEQVGKDISQALTNAATFIDDTLKRFGINTDELRKFFWNDDGTLKSIPEIITGLGNEIEQALKSVKEKLRSIYESFFPSNENGELTGPLGWLTSMKQKVDEFISSIFGSKEELENAEGKASKSGLLQGILGVLGFAGGSSLLKSAGDMSSLFSLSNKSIAGSLNFGKIAIGVAVAAGAFGLLSKVDFSKIGIDFKGFTDYFKDGEGNLLSASEIFTKVGDSISKSKIVTWVTNTSQLIGKNVSTAFGLLKEKSQFFGEFIKVLNESDLTFPEKFSYSLRFFKEQFIIPFGELTKKNLKTIGIDIDAFLAKFKNTEGDWLSVGEILEKAGNKISEGIEHLKSEFEKTEIGKWISEKFQNFKDNNPTITKWFDSFGETITDVGNWIGNTSKLVGRNVGTAFDLLKEKSLYFSTFIKVLNESDLTFPEKFSYALQFFKEQFVEPFGELAKKNLKTIGIDIDAFINFFKDNEGEWLSIGDIISKIGEKIHNAFSDLKEKFEQSNFGKWISEKLEWLNKKFSGVSEFLGNFANLVGRFAIPALGGVGIVLAIRRVGQLFDFITSIGQFFSGRTPLDRANAFAIRVESFANIIKSIALAVLMISVALGGLSMLNQDELTRATDNLTRVLSQVVSVVIAFSVATALISFFRSRRDEDAKEISTVLLEIAGTLFLVAAAFRMIHGIQFNSLGEAIQDFVILGVLMTMVVAFARFSPKLEGSRSTFLGMLGIATAVLEMVGALYLIQLMLESHQGIGWALLTLIGIVGIFAVLCAAAKGINWSAGLGLILMANSVRTMIGALERVADSDLLTKYREEPWQNLLKIVAVFGALAVLAGINRLSGGGKAGLNLLGVAASVWILVQAMEQIAEISPEKMWGALGIVTLLSVVMGGILVAYSALNNGNGASFRSMITTTVQLYSVVIGVLLLCAAVAVLSTIDQTQLITAGSVVAGLTIVVGAIAVLMAAFSRKADFGKSLGLLGTATLVAVAMGALIWALDHYIPDKSDLLRIVGSVAILTVLVGALAYVFGTIRIRLVDPLEVFGALAGMTILVAAVGAILTLIARNFPRDLSTEMLWSIVGAVTVLTVVIALLTGIFSAINIDFSAALKGALALGFFGIVIEALVGIAGLMHRDLGENIDKVVSIAERIGQGLVKMFDSLMTTIGKLNWWQLVAVIGVTAAAIAAAGAFGVPIAIGLGAIIGIVGIVVEVLALFAGIIYGWQGENIEKVVTLMGRAGRGFAEIFDSLMNSIGKLSWQQLLATVVLFSVAIGQIAYLAPTIGLGMGIFAVELAIAAAAVVGILDLTLPWFEKFANDGIPIFEKIASGIVQIASIIMGGIISNVEAIIGCLRDFSNFATNDFNADKVGEAVGIASQLTEVIGAFVGDSFLGMLGKFIGEVLFGEANRDAFIANMGCLTTSLNSFKTNIASWTAVDLAKTKIATDIAQQLTDICDAFTEDNFLTALDKFIQEELFGEDKRQSFIDNVITLGASLLAFGTFIDNLPNFDSGKADSAIGIADKMIELVNKFMPENLGVAIDDWLTNSIFGSDYSDRFKTNIENLSDAVSTFSEKVNGWKIPADYETKFQIVDKLIEFVNKMPELTESSGLMDIADFGESVKAFSESFIYATQYLNLALSKAEIEDYDGKMELINDLIALTDELPRVTGTMQKFLDFNITQTLGDFGKDMETFGTCLNTFATEMNKVPKITNWEEASGVISDLIAFSTLLPKTNSIGEEIVGYNLNTDFAKFGTDIAQFAGSFGIAIERINALAINSETFTKFGQMKAMVSMLAGLAKELPQSFSQADASGNSSMITSTFTQSFSEFMESIVGSKSGWGRGYENTLFDQVQRVYEELDDLEDFTNERKGKLEALVGPNGVLQQLSTFAQSLPEITTDTTTLSTFGVEIYELANHVSDAVATLNGDDTNGMYQFDPEPLKKMAEGIKGIITSFNGIASEDLGHISSILDSISKLKSSDGDDGTGIGKFFGNMVSSLFGIPGSDITTAITNVGSVGDLLGGLGGLGDLLKGVTPEGGFDLSGLSTLFGTVDPTTGAFAGGGVLAGIPTSLDTFITDMPTAEDLSAPTEALTGMFSGITAESFNFDNFAPMFGSFTQGTGFDGTGFIQMLPKEMQNYFTAMKSPDMDVEGTNLIISNLVSGVQEAGSITPDLATNFNTTLTAFANNGISAYTEAFNSDDVDLKLKAAGTTIVKKTGEGIDAALQVLPNEIQTSAKSTVKFISDILSGDESNPYDAPGKPILDKTASGIDKALAGSSQALKTSVKAVVAFIVNILSGNESDAPYKAPGSSIISKTADGINQALKSSGHLLQSAARGMVNVVTNVLSGASQSPNPYTSAGNNVISGFVAGMSNTQSVYDAAYNVGRKAVEGLSAAIESKSPSKEAMKYGKYFGEGFGIGIDSYGEIIKTTSENIGSEALFGLSSYVGKIYELLDSNLDFNPRVTPVLDLSEIQNGVGSINALFSRQHAYSTNMEVTSALRARSEAMTPVSSTTDNSRNFGGFTFNVYTQGTDANAIAKQIGEEVSRRLRASGSMI